MSDRQVSFDTSWRIARVSLGDLACMTGNRGDGEHDHDVCVLDDESYIADQMLRVLAAAVLGDETVALDRLTELMASVAPQ